MDDRPPPAVSLIVCTRDRPTELRPALEAVLRSEFAGYELVVVDQGADPGPVRDIIEVLGDPRLRLIRDDGAGLARARNIGVRATAAPLVVFTDDDCEPDVTWLGRVVAALEDDAGAGLVFGSVVPAPCDPAAGFIVGYTPARRRRLTGRLAKRLDGGIGANMSFRRAALDAAGPFDEYLGAGSYFPSCEDGDMAYRILCAGWAILHEPDAVVVHHGLRDWKSGSALTRRTYMAVAAAYAKHARCGDPVGALLIVHSMWLATVNVVGAIIRRRRPVGIGRLLAHLTGVRRSFEMRVDRRARLYVAKSGAPR